MTLHTLVLLTILGCGGGDSTPATRTPEPAPAASTEAKPPVSKPTTPTSLNEVGSVDLEGFKKLHGEGVTVIDVRTDEEFASGHVPGAVHVSLDTVSPHHDAIKDLPKDQPLYMICESGRRSSRAAKLLASAGYTTVNVEGGTGAWRSAGLPLEK